MPSMRRASGQVRAAQAARVTTAMTTQASRRAERPRAGGPGTGPVTGGAVACSVSLAGPWRSWSDGGGRRRRPAAARAVRVPECIGWPFPRGSRGRPGGAGPGRRVAVVGDVSDGAARRSGGAGGPAPLGDRTPAVGRPAGRPGAGRAGADCARGGDPRPPLPADPFLLAGRGLGRRLGPRPPAPARAAHLLDPDRLDPAAAPRPPGRGAGALPAAAAGLRRPDRPGRLAAGTHAGS